MDHQARKRVSGASLSQNLGKAVTLLGEIVQLEPNGRVFTMKTSSNDVVTVQLDEPVQDLLNGIVEVQGIVSNNNTIKCQNIVKFPASFTEKLDMSLYNEVISLAERLPSHQYITME